MKAIIKVIATLCLSLIYFISFSSIEVVGSLKHSSTGIPGETYTGQIKIQNSGEYAQEVRIYQTDYLFNYEDYTLYDDPGSHDRSNATWLKYSPATTIVNPKGTQFIQYEINIPAGDTIKGTYWSVLMVEGVNPINPHEQGKLSINTVTRYAIQIVTEIADQGQGLLEFLQPTMITENGKLMLAVDVINGGEHFIAPEVSIELFDEEGNSVKKIETNRKGIYPYTSTRFRLDLEGIEGNKTYQALIIAAGEDEDVFGIEYTLFF